MLDKNSLIKSFRAGRMAQNYDEVMRYGFIASRKDVTIAGKAYSWVDAVHHGLQWQFALVCGEVQSVSMSTQNNLF